MLLVKILRNLAESLNLKAKTIGNISGIATSLPEFFTVCLASIAGLQGTSIFNILSSNIINFVQYLWATVANKNLKLLKNKALKINITIVIITILIPIFILYFNIKMEIPMAIIFIILFIFFYKLNINSHKLYLQKYDKKIEEIMEKEYNEEKKWKTGKKKLILKYIIYILVIGILLFIIGQKLSNNLENLCYVFNIPEYIVGIILGFGTSIPELITFFEAQKSNSNKSERELGLIEATNNLLISNMLNIFIIQSIAIFLSII